jgi:DNA-binding NtrC family response regulator
MYKNQDDTVKILFVDDEQGILQSLVSLTRNEEFVTLVASSGEEGLEILTNIDGIGVIVSDQLMPGISGIDFLQKVWEIAPDTIRILLTGHNAPEVENEALCRAGVFRFIAKPWKNEELIQTLRDAAGIFSLIRDSRQLTARMTDTSRENTESHRQNTISSVA